MKNFVCSWSGGKDSCLALHEAVEMNMKPMQLLTMVQELGSYSRSHRIPVDVLHAQADSLKIQLLTINSTWDEYESKFIRSLKDIRKNNITEAVFGDIDLAQHLEWEEMVCRKADMNPCLPLWHHTRKGLMNKFIQLGYKAVIVTVNTEMLHERFLGRELTTALSEELEREGIDICGENGEYHTLVIDGPLFSVPVKIETGDVVRYNEKYASLDLFLAL